MKRRNYLAALLFALVLLSGCAANTPVETGADEAPAMDAQAEPVAAEKVPEIPVFEPREPYRLNEAETQLLQDGDEITVDGICRFTVKGFGCGRMVTADGNTCAGAKKGEVLVWLTCDYVNLSGAKVSSKKLIKQAHIRYDGGYSVGKSASFSKIVPDETVEVYFYYPIPEALDTEAVTMEFTIGEQAYRYEVPADRDGAIEPTFPKKADETDSEETPADGNETVTAGAGGARTERVENANGEYTETEYNDAGVMIKQSYYDANGGLKAFDEYDSAGRRIKWQRSNGVGGIFEYNEAGQEVKFTRYNENGVIDFVTVYEYDSAGRKFKESYYDGSGVCTGYLVNEFNSIGNVSTQTAYRGDGSVSRVTIYDNGKTVSSTKYNAAGEISYIECYDENGKWVQKNPDGTIRNSNG